MEPVSKIIYRIQFASPHELEYVLEDINRESFQENGWDVLSVHTFYSTVLQGIEDALSQCRKCLDLGKDEMRVADSHRPEVQRVLEVRPAIPKLQMARDFFQNPPLVENPNEGGFSVPAIDWSKPVYTVDEVKALLGVSDSTFRRWLTGGWISYTQMDGSDKKFIQKEHLLAFLNNKKIFYPSSK